MKKDGVDRIRELIKFLQLQDQPEDEEHDEDDEYSTAFLEEESEKYPDGIDILKDFLTYTTYPDADLPEEIIREKIRLHKTSLTHILNLILERELDRQNNLALIESESIKAQVELFPYKCIRYPIMPDNKRKGNLERAISELENRRRQEDTAFWKDTFKLWEELLKIAAEYRATVRKARILLFTE